MNIFYRLIRSENLVQVGYSLNELKVYVFEGDKLFNIKNYITFGKYFSFLIINFYII